MFQHSLRTLLVRALVLEVADVVADALVAEAVEVQPTAISVNSEVVLEADLDSALVVDMVVLQLLHTAVASEDLLPQLPTVVLLHMVVALAVAAMATPPEVVVANLGGNLPSFDAALFLFDSTSVHLRWDKGVNGYPLGIHFLFFSVPCFAFSTFAALSTFWWRHYHDQAGSCPL